MSLRSIDIDDSSPSRLFQSTVAAVHDILSEQECNDFGQYGDVTSVVEGMQSFSASAQENNSRLTFCCRKFAAFFYAFSPYFNVARACTHIKSEWSGSLWGLGMLLFKRGSDYILFLERIAAMIESLVVLLPRYHQYFDVPVHKCAEVDQDHVAHILSYLFSDIVQFCLHAYCLFPSSLRGPVLRHRLNPPQYGYCIPFDSRFTRLRHRLKKHQEWFEGELRNQDCNQRIQLRTEFLAYLRDAKQMSHHHDGEELLLKKGKKIDAVKVWIAGSEDNRPVYRYIERAARSEVGSWFFDLAEYCEWRSHLFDRGSAHDVTRLRRNWLQRILFVQANSGFGKSMLSRLIINDLASSTGSTSDEERSHATASFHFRPTSTCMIGSAVDAFRAVAVQLLETYRDNPVVSDALALLTNKALHGQNQASFEDTLSIIRLLLRQCPTFLVFDGLDECLDSERFLISIRTLCQTCDCKVLILSQPNIPLPLKYHSASDSPRLLSLDASHNASDIETYLHRNLKDMAAEGLFGSQQIEYTRVQQLRHLSDGIFLWAKLYIDYLGLPGLSAHERRLSLEKAGLLKGLRSLYNAILDVLSRRLGKEKRPAIDIFRWLSHSVTPLNDAALHTALAIIPGRAVAEDQYLTDFAKSINHVTCSLAERNDSVGRVSFIHCSIKDYLKSPYCRNPDFNLADDDSSHAHLASRCLSYVTYDVPKRPLQKLQPYHVAGSGLSTVTSLRTARSDGSDDSGYRSVNMEDADAVVIDDTTSLAFDVHLPFLRYAALCWPIHLSRALSGKDIRREHIALWLPILSRFLLDRYAVTVWVEASWRYHLPPNLSRLVPLISALQERVKPSSPEARELAWVITGLKYLREALNELRNDYGVTLDENPSLIWQWNIQAATDSMFWPVWDEKGGM